MNKGREANALLAWEQRLAERRVLSTDPRGLISIKRDVHTVEVDADPAAFADAFHITMRSPGSRFGLLEVRRPQKRVGKPFVLGDRFQGRFNLAGLIELSDWGPDSLLGRSLRSAGVSWALNEVADVAASDYGVIDLFQLDGELVDGVPTYMFRYRYLEGSPIAGSSTFAIQGCARGCRLVQTFEYQELRVPSAALFGVIGVNVHNRVIYEQVLQSAQRIGASILDTDIPDSGFME